MTVPHGHRVAAVCNSTLRRDAVCRSDMRGASGFLGGSVVNRRRRRVYGGGRRATGHVLDTRDSYGARKAR